MRFTFLREIGLTAGLSQEKTGEGRKLFGDFHFFSFSCFSAKDTYSMSTQNRKLNVGNGDFRRLAAYLIKRVKDYRKILKNHEDLV